MKSELRFETKKIRWNVLGEETCVPDLVGQSIFQNNLNFYLDEEEEIYEGYGTKKNSYPYRQYTCYGERKEEREWKVAVLENEYLEAVFMLELGGRLWSLYDKKAKKNLLYTNDVVQFRNLAIRNAWFSGGVEWNIGIIGHTPLTTEPMHTAVVKDEKGNSVLRMYEYERIRQVEYQMDFWLGEEDDFLSCRMRIVNSGKEVVPMYWWSNMAVPEHKNGRVVVPAKTAYTSGGKDVEKVEIPYVDGIDISHYDRIPKQVDYFFHIEKENPKFIANLDENGYGLFHLSTKRLQSRKLFSWGHNDGSAAWQSFLTEAAGDYLEIQAGLGKTQYGCIPMAPNTAWEWMEQYGAVKVEAQQEKTFEELREELTAYANELLKERRTEEILKETKVLAKTPGTLVQKGSGYGALKNICRNQLNERSLSAHLDYGTMEEKQKMWADFFETGVLPKHQVCDVPEDFICEKEMYLKLKASVLDVNKENWYAYYQMGLYELWIEDLERAEASLRKSLELEMSPWSCHALGSCLLQKGENHEAIFYMTKGVDMYRENKSYVKEGLRLLMMAGGYQEILDIYAKLSDKLKMESRIYFCYLNALHQVGESQKAYDLLRAKDSFVLEDLRECENSLGKLWTDLEVALFGECKGIPKKFQFEAL